MTQQSNPFKKASKTKAKLRLALMGTSGTGKTYTALSIAQPLGRVAVIDTEHGSASKYADRFTFDVLELSNYHPQQYIDAIKAAAAAGYDVVIIDSLTHAWSGTGGALELVDQETKRSKSNNSYMAWGAVTPLHNRLIEAIVGAPMHVIATLRSKTEYVLEKGDNGKSVPRKVGMAPVQRDGMEYEFDVVGEMDTQNSLTITKSRVPDLTNQVFDKPGVALGETLLAWLNDGAEAPKQEPPPPLQAVTVASTGTPPTPPLQPTGDASGDTFDRDFPPMSQSKPVEQGYTDFLCHEIVYTVTNGGSQYTFKSEHGTNIVVFGSDWVLDIADYANRDVFKNKPGKVQQLKPPLVVTARFADKKWDVERITTLEAVTQP